MKLFLLATTALVALAAPAFADPLVLTSVAITPADVSTPVGFQASGAE